MQLIMDRTEADVLLGNEKGRYGCDDLNRVESFVKSFLPMFAQMDIGVSLTVKTDWQFKDLFSINTWPVHSQMARYLGNIRTICRVFQLDPELPESMDRLTHTGANQIEQALLSAYLRAEGVINAYKFSGELFAGEE